MLLLHLPSRGRNPLNESGVHEHPRGADHLRAEQEGYFLYFFSVLRRKEFDVLDTGRPDLKATWVSVPRFLRVARVFSF